MNKVQAIAAAAKQAKQAKVDLAIVDEGKFAEVEAGGPFGYCPPQAVATLFPPGSKIVGTVSAKGVYSEAA